MNMQLFKAECILQFPLEPLLVAVVAAAVAVVFSSSRFSFEFSSDAGFRSRDFRVNVECHFCEIFEQFMLINDEY